jgi:hypothetical protein
VIDGDTIEVSGERIRLHGIDAPEMAQLCEWPGKTIECGVIAKTVLMELVAGGEIRCEELDRDRYGRIVAVCYAGGHDMSRNMVYAGWAIAYRRFSSEYVGAEAEARESERGMWRGTFVAPWDFRRGGGPELGAGAADLAQIPDAAADPGGDCLIKGNISRGGERIYHVPGGASYSRTIIDPSKGERWFCTEAEARATEWRRSKR